MLEHLRSALMEAYEQSHELNRTPLTQDEKNSLLDRFERNNRINGIPFNRAATEKDMDAHPWKYRKFVNRRPVPLSQLKNNNNILNPTPSDARNKIYDAALDAVRRFYAQYHIPFNAAAQFKYIQHVDKTIKHMPFMRKLHQVVDIAYPGIDLESELKKLQGNRDFRDFFGVLQDTFEKALVHPQDKTLFEIWRTLHELKEVSARLGR